MADLYALAATWIRTCVPPSEMTEEHREVLNAYVDALAERLGVDAACTATRSTRYAGGDDATPDTQRRPITLRLALLPPGEREMSDACKYGARKVLIYPDNSVTVAEGEIHASARRMMSLETQPDDGIWPDAALASTHALLMAMDAYYVMLRAKGVDVPLASYLP
tara:strand:- start:914 stop:1408 length:495 start_codon:yes stop_codon:yes gene_type:complete